MNHPISDPKKKGSTQEVTMTISLSKQMVLTFPVKTLIVILATIPFETTLREKVCLSSMSLV
jgi:hypothetical protein